MIKEDPYPFRQRFERYRRETVTPLTKAIRPLSNFVYANSIFRLIEDLFAELRSN
jgi:hypothetical protein